MVHFFSQSIFYDHDWTTVNNGLCKKYPNPHSGHVISVDVLDRSVDPVTGVLRTERILGCKQAAPRWVVKMLGGSEDAFVREVTFVDPSTCRTTVTSVNLSLSQYITVLETLSYEPASSDAPSKTLFRQTAEIQSRMSWKSVGDRLEAWCVDRFSTNAALGRLGFEHVLRSLRERSEEEQMAAV